jgi:hypothetical protein
MVVGEGLISAEKLKCTSYVMTRFDLHYLDEAISLGLLY